ncbi:hypothetical protein AX14_001547 [Amanita brunnescens Koide BX004]|nr:hypothetical protein AX14_001547 [Amanita brunnescens Koide BX004]
MSRCSPAACLAALISFAFSCPSSLPPGHATWSYCTVAGNILEGEGMRLFRSSLSRDRFHLWCGMAGMGS